MILDTEIRNSAPTILTMSNDANLSKIPTEARLLLDYYSTRIIDVMSMSPEHKPPWKTIHLPCAMSALAEQLVYGEARSLAKMALFYALLSISSYHMGSADKDSVDRAQYWIARGAVHKKNAEAYLRSALDNTKSKASRGKYKEILMSVLSMVTIGVCETVLSIERSNDVTGFQWKYARCSRISRGKRNPNSELWLAQAVQISKGLQTSPYIFFPEDYRREYFSCGYKREGILGRKQLGRPKSYGEERNRK